MSTLAPTLQAFFTDRLARQRHVSEHTITAYRDALKMLPKFAASRTGKQPCDLQVDDLDAALVGAFLEHLESDRGNSTRTRNARLSAIHALFRFAALEHPEHAEVIQRVLAIPPKRYESRLVTYLTDEEIDALVAAPDTTTWAGRRDHALLVLAVQTGLRVSELTSLTRGDAHLGAGAHVTCTGKGRRQRITPLTATTAKVLKAWTAAHTGGPADPPFPSRHGNPMSRDVVERRLQVHATTATSTAPTLAGKKVSPHVLRHYVDGGVMSQAGAFRLVGASPGPARAT